MTGKQSLARMATALLALGAMMLTPGCVLLHAPQFGEQYSATEVTPFSRSPEGLRIPHNWRPYILSRLKRSTDFVTVNVDGTVVVRAVADSSASGLSQKTSIMLTDTPILTWRWQVSGVAEGADNKIGPDDAAARVVIAFEGDKESLDFEDRAFADRIKALSGNEVPYATLMYIWSSKDPVGTLIDNKHTSRIKMIVAESGRDKLNTWVSERWNLREDFKRAFGEEPGRVLSVGVMTDTDNTGVKLVTHYGDISLTRP